MNSNSMLKPPCRSSPRRERVADSSIFPHVTFGNLNRPSIMTGGKAADHILGKQPLARSNQEP
ncbi:hypothetical protein [Rhizobium sp. 10PS4]|uniref:hypothetical protein n=1 Tax=Rhizobium sp. 10PS4 TaxID=3075621 RepID=UPI0028FDB05C|nr:hypothetical protein [Rhizobium sp. 10PS4]MDU0310476.1 hypothetical protein [Rhizobium sp. 10PS4]